MNIIPLPNLYRRLPGSFLVPEELAVNYSQELAPTAQLLENFIKNTTGVNIKKSLHSQLNLTLDFSLENEQYHILVDESNIHLAARTNRGAFYGLQTLKQLIKQKGSHYYIDSVFIDDRPRFSYRGFMLDVARHFFPKEDIFRLIDIISFHKLNVLHLHLTDDQGWRIESEKYPHLTEIGSIRNTTYSRKNKKINFPHYGYYTKNDLKDIVSYAKERHIEVIPEIDMPGHMNALIAAYPDTSCLKSKISVRENFGISDITLCPGNNEVYKMLTDIILETFDIFESPYFHIGGDEVPKKHWKKCPLCQHKIKENNLKNEKELATFFTNYFCELLIAHNKIPIIWNDGISSKLSARAVLQHWKMFTRKKSTKEINRGRKAIISDFAYFYLDYPYGMTPLKKTYQFEPIPKGVHNKDNILGIEAPLWTEWVRDRDKMDFQIFPRLTAIAETAWTESQNKSYEDFVNRLEPFYQYYRKMNVKFAQNVTFSPALIKRFFATLSWLRDENSEYNKNGVMK